jgi:hypothetical protein
MSKAIGTLIAKAKENSAIISSAVLTSQKKGGSFFLLA